MSIVSILNLLQNYLSLKINGKQYLYKEEIIYAVLKNRLLDFFNSFIYSKIIIIMTFRLLKEKMTKTKKIYLSIMVNI